MSNKLTIIKVLPKDGECSPSREDLERWRQKFAANEQAALDEGVASGEIEIEVLPEKSEKEHYITFVKVGDKDFKPTYEDLEQWRQVFKDAAEDPDFKIFTHSGVEIELIPIGDIVDVE